MGEDRFEKSVLGELSKCVHQPMNCLLPLDASHVILNGYDTRFSAPVDTKLKENVEPMLKILQECETRQDHIKGISIVSTAYVQPPSPFTHPEDGRIPWALNGHISVSDLYEELVNGGFTWKGCLDRYGHLLHRHYTVDNPYAFSKHMMEHIISERHSNLPIAFVRPSTIAPSRDGANGFDVQTGISAAINIANKGLMRVPRPGGILNCVHVEDTARDCLAAATDWAKPAERCRDGKVWHPIRLSSSDGELSIKRLFDAVSPDVNRIYSSSRTIRLAARKVEEMGFGLSAGPKAAKLANSLYKNFDQFTGQRWKLPATHAFDIDAFLEMCKAKVHVPPKRGIKVTGPAH